VCSTPREQHQCCGCGGNHTASYRGCVKWKEARAALAKQAPQRATRNAPAAPKAQQPGPSAEQLALGEGWSHVFLEGRVAKATATTPPPNPNPNPPPQPVTEVPRVPKVTATRKKAGPKKSEPKPTAAAQPAAGKSKKKIAASVKTAATRGNLRSPRSPSPPSMCGADSSALHIHLPPPHRDSPPAGCVEDRYSLRGRIWLHAQGEQYGVKPYASPAGMLT